MSEAYGVNTRHDCSKQHVWSDSDRRAKFFRRRPERRLPFGYRSATREAWDREMAEQVEREARQARESAAHIERLREAEEAQKWCAAVARFGADVVEELVGRTRPGFRLPEALRTDMKDQTNGTD
jgi:hypothetical protein